MKILVGQNHLDTIGGSETYTYTLIKALKEFGADVELLVGQEDRLGIVSNKIKKDFGIKANKLTGNYDACFLSHRSSVLSYLKQYEEVDTENVFQIIHGVRPPEEKPVLDKGIKYIAISKEVQQYLEDDFELESTYVPNFIDTTKFTFEESFVNLKVCLSLSQSDVFNQMLGNICKKKRLTFLSNNKFTNPIFSIENKIHKADLVFSLGRGVYEAMACGRNVIVSDHRPYQMPYSDGFLTPHNFFDFHENNCSGRKMLIETTEEFLINEMEKYDSYNGFKLSVLAKDYLDYHKNCLLLLKQIK